MCSVAAVAMTCWQLYLLTPPLNAVVAGMWRWHLGRRNMALRNGLFRCFVFFYTEAYPASSSHIINSQFLTHGPVNRTRTLIKSQALLCAIQLRHKLNVLAHSRRQFTSVSSMDTFILCVYVLILCACLTAGSIRLR